MSNILEHIRSTTPGRYLTVEEQRQLIAQDPGAARRIDAANAAQAIEQEVLKATIERVFRKFEFEKRFQGREKCYRDVGLVYQWTVYCMVEDSPEMLENKLLFWLRTILQSLGFPGEKESILLTYSLLRKETMQRLPPEHRPLLDPYFLAVEKILPEDTP